jgi:hypothetical protein
VLIDGYYQYFNIAKENIFGFKPLPEHSQRLTGVFGKEPIIGSFLFHIGFPAIIFLISYINDKVSNLFYNFFLISLIIFFYLTLILISGERTSFLMALFGFSIVIILFQKNKIKICLSFVFFILFFYFMILYNPYVKQRYSDFISETTLNRLFNTKTFQDNSNNKIRLDIDITVGDLIVSEFNIESPNVVNVIQNTTYRSKFNTSEIFAFTDESLKQFVDFLNKFNGMKLDVTYFKFLDKYDDYNKQ